VISTYVLARLAAGCSAPRSPSGLAGDRDKRRRGIVHLQRVQDPRHVQRRPGPDRSPSATARWFRGRNFGYNDEVAFVLRSTTLMGSWAVRLRGGSPISRPPALVSRYREARTAAHPHIQVRRSWRDPKRCSVTPDPGSAHPHYTRRSWNMTANTQAITQEPSSSCACNTHPSPMHAPS